MTARPSYFPCDHCGWMPFDGCTCPTPTEALALRPSIEARHRQAVARAQHPYAAVTIQDAMDLAADRQRTVRPQQRAVPGQPSLDEMADAVIGKRRAA